MSDKFEMYRQLLSGGSTSDMSLFCDNCSDDILPIGGTRIQTFNLPFDYKLIHKLLIVYTQDGNIILKKDLSNCIIADFDHTLLYFRLEEYETVLFHEGEIKIQMKVLLEDGSILVSAILHAKAIKSLGETYFSNDSIKYLTVQANVNSQDVTAINYSDIAAGANLIHICKFNFDSTWDQFQQIFACFKDEYNNISREVVITNDMCIIPSEFISGPGNFYVAAIGRKGSAIKPTKWSNAVRVSSSCLFDPTTGRSHESGGGGGDVPYADEDTAGIMKLYQESGYNTDGTVSQRAITEGFDSIAFDTDKQDKECLVLNVDF